QDQPSRARVLDGAAGARRSVERLGAHCTPGHGSRADVAGVGVSVLARQCPGRRARDPAAPRAEVAAREAGRSAAAVRVDWRLTTADARVKLERLYPVLEQVTSAVVHH